MRVEFVMSSFSCPHFDMAKDFCTRLRTGCVPGRPGCVFEKTSVFAVPGEERIRQKRELRVAGEPSRHARNT